MIGVAAEGLWNVYRSEAMEGTKLVETVDVVKVVAVVGDQDAVSGLDWRQVGQAASRDAVCTIYLTPRPQGESLYEMEKSLWRTLDRPDGCDCIRQTEAEEVVSGLYRGRAVHHEGCGATRARSEGQGAEG